jgi:hypothetical protein
MQAKKVVIQARNREASMNAVWRTGALTLGLVGAVVGFIVNLLYSLAHVLGRVAGVTANQSHFFIGTGLAILAGIGALVSAGAPEVGALLMVLAIIGFAFIIGWWAVIPGVFLVVAAGMAILGRVKQQPAHTGA